LVVIHGHFHPRETAISAYFRAAIPQTHGKNRGKPAFRPGSPRNAVSRAWTFMVFHGHSWTFRPAAIFPKRMAPPAANDPRRRGPPAAALGNIIRIRTGRFKRGVRDGALGKPA
jgi:hypothetical protein